MNKYALRVLLAVTGTALLASCGGGGGGSSSTSTPAPANTTALNVTAATGAPLIGAAVMVVDSNGVSQNCDGVTADNGTLTCNLPKTMAPPYLIRAQASASTMFAVLPSASAAVNVTPVSDLMAKQFANSNGLTPENIIISPAAMTSTTQASAQSAVDVVSTLVKTVAAKSGSITIANDPLTGFYNPLSATDPLDQFVKNYPVNTDGNRINIVVPTATGVTNVSISSGTASSGAASVVNAAIASAGTPTAVLTDSDQIDTLLARLSTDIASCDASAQADMVALMDGTYASGRTISDFVKIDICSGSLKGPNKVTKGAALARIGSTVIYPVVITNLSTNQAVTTNFGFRKVGGNWKWAADNLPFNSSIVVRQSLNFLVSPDPKLASSYEPTVAFERYLDAWIGAQDAYIASALPDRIQVYVFNVGDINDDTLTSSSKFNSFTPDFTLYKRTGPFTVNSGCQALYTVQKDRTSCDNSIQELDNGYNLALPSLFANKLQKNPLSFFVYKLIDVNGSCMNCVNGLPNAGDLQGQALPFKSLFPNIASTKLNGMGVAVSSLSSQEKQDLRNYFAIPSDADFKTLMTQLGGVNMTNTLTVPWVRAQVANAYQIDLWENTNTCGNSSINISDSVDTFDIGNANSHTFTYGQYRSSADKTTRKSSPEFGKTFNNASYFSASLATKYNTVEYVSRMQADRFRICTP